MCPPATFSGSNFFRHYKRRTIAAVQKPSGLLVPNDLLSRGIEAHRASQTVRGIRQMHQRRRNVCFLDRRMNILSTAAANAINKVRIVVAGSLAGWPPDDLIRHP